MAMNSYARLVESVRRTRNTLYLVAGLYIVVGFVVATTTAMQHDRLGTFLGFIIISGALSMGLIARTALQVLVRIAHIERSLNGFAESVENLIPLAMANVRASNAAVSAAESLVDLANVGVGDPKVLAAATLDRDVYPRLVTTMERGTEGPSLAAPTVPSPELEQAGKVGNGRSNGAGTAITKDLLQQWKSAMADEDLVLCRQVFSAIVDLADHEAVSPLRRQIQELEDRVERRLRDRFGTEIRRRDFAAALQTGEQITALLGDHPVAADFERLRPILTRRADEALAVSPAFH